MNTREAAEVLNLSHQSVSRIATRLAIGVNWGGSKGYDFTEADLDKIRDAHRPKPVPARRRKASA